MCGFGKYFNFFCSLHWLIMRAFSYDPIDGVGAGNPRISWSALQGLFLDECDAHTLFILDCSFAGASVRLRGGSSTVEAICASGFHNTAPTISKYSLTTFLTKTLKECRAKNQSIYAKTLCQKVTADMNQASARGQSHVVSPYHINFSDNPNSIILSALIAPKDKKDQTRFYASHAGADSMPETSGPSKSAQQPHGKGIKPVRAQKKSRFSISSWKMFGRSSSRHRDES